MRNKPSIPAGLLWLAVTAAIPFNATAHDDHEHEHHEEHEHHDEHEHHEEDHGDGYRDHGAHVHGIAQLTLALEGDRIGIHIASPAANILGFEHRARTDAQQQQVIALQASLNEPASLFTFIGTQCSATETDVDVSSVTRMSDSEADKPSSSESHSDIEAHYQFQCKQGSQLQTVNALLLQQFTGIERVEVQWVTDTSQGAQVLTRQASVIKLR